MLGVRVMSWAVERPSPVTVEYQRVPPHDDAHVDEAWDVKEEIRQREGYLQQTYDFFRESYENNTDHLYLVEGDVVAFSVVRNDGYLLFLGVAPEHRGGGLGRALVQKVEEDHTKISCHTRESNENALEFYRHLGFEKSREVRSYYRNGETAYFLVDDSGSSLKTKLSGVIGKRD